jgi:hypothetical protein
MWYYFWKSKLWVLFYAIMLLLIYEVLFGFWIICWVLDIHEFGVGSEFSPELVCGLDLGIRFELWVWVPWHYIRSVDITSFTEKEQFVDFFELLVFRVCLGLFSLSYFDFCAVLFSHNKSIIQISVCYFSLKTNLSCKFAEDLPKRAWHQVDDVSICTEF